ncbi:MAG: hypothetical protein E6J69_02285, partial [Deltaproteobacteria bacterium]
MKNSAQRISARIAPSPGGPLVEGRHAHCLRWLLMLALDVRSWCLPCRPRATRVAWGARSEDRRADVRDRANRRGVRSQTCARLVWGRLRWAMAAPLLLVPLIPSGARATITPVKNVGTAANETSGTTISVTVPAAGVALGNTVIVTFAMDPASGTVSVADTQGNTYTKNADVTNGSGTSGVRTVVFSSTITTALVSGSMITVTHPTVTAKAVSANEFSGLVANPVADQSGTATGSATSLSATTSGATAQAEELVMGGFGREGKAGEFSANGAGFTALTQASSGNAGASATHITIDSQFKVVTATGIQTANETANLSENWAATVVTYKSKCGNGTLDGGESCDTGAANGTSGSCCTATCGFVTSGTTCRAAVNECDLAETCTGSSGTCPTDQVKPAGTACTDDGNVCTTDLCNGTVGSPLCVHNPGNAGTVCRAATAGGCDVAETCTGSSSTCPSDAFQPSTFTCRAAAGECDIAENCPGTSPNCPSDAKKANGTACTDDGNVCT